MDFTNKKITRLLLFLSAKEKRRALLYLKSPYFVGPEYQKILTRLFKLLDKRLKEKGGMLIDDSILCRQVFEDDQVVPGKIDKFLSMLQKELIKMLGLESVERSEQIGIAAAAQLRKRGEHLLWNVQYKKIAAALKKSKIDPGELSLDEFKLTRENFYFRNLELRKNSKSTYDNIFEAIDKFYIDEMLQIGIQLLASNNFIFPLDMEPRFQLLKNLLEGRKEVEKTTRQEVREKAFELLSNYKKATKTEIDGFLKLLSAKKKDLSNLEYDFLRYIARSFVIHLYNRDMPEMQPIVLSMYQADFEDASIFYNGKLPASTLNNITTFAIREKQLDWISQVLDEQEGNILEPEIGDFIIQLNRAKVFFAQAQYQLALDTISFDAKDFFLKINARILELRCHFELRSEQLDFKVEAYKLFIYRIPKGKVSLHFRQGHNDFVDVMKSLCHPNTSMDPKRLEKVKIKIEQTKFLAEKKWLIEKVQQLLMASTKRRR